MAELGLSVNVELLGERKLREKFDALPMKLANKILKQEFGKAEKAYRKKLKGEIPIGETRKLLFGHEKRSRARRGRVTVWTAWKGREWFGIAPDDTHFYPSVVYHGAKERGQAPNKYMERAWKSIENATERELTSAIRDRIIAAAKEGGTSAGKGR